MSSKIIASCNRLYSRYRKVARGKQGMSQKNPWQKKYCDMTAEQKKDKVMWCTYYKQKELIYDITGTYWKGYAKGRSLTLTLNKHLSIDQFNTRMANLRREMKKQGMDIFNEHLTCRYISPETGEYHAHITLFNVDSSISNKEYREAMEKIWKCGSINFGHVHNIYRWTHYMIAGLKPDSDQCIKDKCAVRVSYGKDMKRPEVVTRENMDMIYDHQDVIRHYKHKHSNSETIILKPSANVQFTQAEQNKGEQLVE